MTDPALRDAIGYLLAIKRAALESEYGSLLPVINAFIDAELARLGAALQPVPSDTDFSMLDRLLLDTVMRK